MSAGGEARGIADESVKGGRGEQADSGHRAQAGDDGDLYGQGLELRLDILDACGQRGDLLAKGGEAGLEGLGQATVVVLDDLPGFGQDVFASLGDEEAERGRGRRAIPSAGDGVWRSPAG